MPKRKAPVLDNSTARDIFNELDLYARDKQFYPLEHALFIHMTRFVRAPDGVLSQRYEMSINTYRYWFGRLVEEGHIEIDPDTRAIRCVHLVIVEKDTP